MPHQCVRCGSMFKDGAKELLSGCSCGGRFFFFMKKAKIKAAEEMSATLTKEDRLQIEKDVAEIVGDPDPDQPVFLDIESVRVLKPGKYEIDLVELFKGKPVVYKVEDGKYLIDLDATLKSKKER